ncbi:Hypothetical predicted protein, partial [Pelobates cultripes]
PFDFRFNSPGHRSQMVLLQSKFFLLRPTASYCGRPPYLTPLGASPPGGRARLLVLQISGLPDSLQHQLPSCPAILTTVFVPHRIHTSTMLPCSASGSRTGSYSHHIQPDA